MQIFVLWYSTAWRSGWIYQIKMQRQSQSQKYGWNSNTLKFEHLDCFWTFTDTKMQLFICRFFIVLNFLSIHLKFHALKDTKSPKQSVVCILFIRHTKKPIIEKWNEYWPIQSFFQKWRNWNLSKAWVFFCLIWNYFVIISIWTFLDGYQTNWI